MDILKNILKQVGSSLGSSLGSTGSKGVNVASVLGNLLSDNKNSADSSQASLEERQAPQMQEDSSFNIDDIVGKLTSGGFGNVISSWISDNPNKNIDGSDLSQVFSSAQLSAIGRRIGLDSSQVLNILPKLLPSLASSLTNDTKDSAGGLPSSLASLLNSLK